MGAIAIRPYSSLSEAVKEIKRIAGKTAAYRSFGSSGQKYVAYVNSLLFLYSRKNENKCNCFCRSGCSCGEWEIVVEYSKAVEDGLSDVVKNGYDSYIYNLEKKQKNDRNSADWIRL